MVSSGRFSSRNRRTDGALPAGWRIGRSGLRAHRPAWRPLQHHHYVAEEDSESSRSTGKTASSTLYHPSPAGYQDCARGYVPFAEYGSVQGSPRHRLRGNVVPCRWADYCKIGRFSEKPSNFGANSRILTMYIEYAGNMALVGDAQAETEAMQRNASSAPACGTG